MPEGNIVFVAGALRSGTTLLRLMLDHHPDLSNSGEFDFLFDQDNDVGAFPDSAGYRDWLAYNRIFLEKNLKIDEALDYPALVRSFVSQLASDRGVSCFNIHRHFDRVPRIFPAAKFIHLLRDPRDVARSSIGMGWAGHVYFGVEHWIETERSWGRLQPQLQPGQYLEVTYEGLVKNPEQVLRSICHFLEVDYDPAVFNYSEKSTYAAPDQSLIEQWRRKLSPRELQLVESRIGDLLVERGYQPSQAAVVPGLLERLWLKVLNKLFVWRFSIQRYGLSLYLSEKISRYALLNNWNKRCQQQRNAIDVRYLK